jgi:hypothetical protein
VNERTRGEKLIELSCQSFPTFRDIGSNRDDAFRNEDQELSRALICALLPGKLTLKNARILSCSHSGYESPLRIQGPAYVSGSEFFAPRVDRCAGGTLMPSTSSYSSRFLVVHSHLDVSGLFRRGK